MDPYKGKSLKHITDILLSKISSIDHEVGYSDRVEGDEYKSNYIFFEKDGWSAEISYSLCGKWSISRGDYWTPDDADLLNVWGRVDELTVMYEDPETGDVTEFFKNELKELCSRILETIRESIL